MKEYEVDLLRSLLENQLALLESRNIYMGIGPCADENEFASRMTEAYAKAAENERAARLAAEIRQALDQMRNARYGRCKDCGEDIGWARLQARPMAQCCVDCQEERERCAA